MREFGMFTVTVHTAKKNLSKLLAQVEAGEESVFARGNTLVAWRAPIHPRPATRRFGAMKWIVSVGPELFEPTTEAELKEWE
jgi:antitoxin (DNA-binding transcriptional repressor) of toxin-antitoxin stability system